MTATHIHPGRSRMLHAAAMRSMVLAASWFDSTASVIPAPAAIPQAVAPSPRLTAGRGIFFGRGSEQRDDASCAWFESKREEAGAATISHTPARATAPVCLTSPSSLGRGAKDPAPPVAGRVFSSHSRGLVPAVPAGNRALRTATTGSPAFLSR